MVVKSESSRFTKTDLVTMSGYETYGQWVRQDFLVTELPESQIGRYQVTSARAGRPDLIAAEVYSDSKLFWVLIAYNNAREVLNWPAAGETIKYPIESVVIPEVIG